MASAQTETDIHAEIGEALGALFRGAEANAPVRGRLEEILGRPVDRSGFMLVARIARDEPLRLSRLAQGCGLDLSTVSRRIADLEHEGLVTREVDPADARASMLRLTVAGKRLLRKLVDARKTLLAEVLADWPDQDRRDLARLLTRFTDELASYGRSA